MVLVAEPLAFSSFVSSRHISAQDAQNEHSTGHGACLGLQLVVLFHWRLWQLLPTERLSVPG
jgi:hypothetical protein